MHLSGKRIAIIATDYFEEIELTSPRDELQKGGATVDIIAPKSGSIQGLRHVEKGQAIAVDKVLADADPADYDALVVPGGAINADHLRMEEKAGTFLSDMLQAGKPVAIICHGPWLLVSAGLAKGRKLTSYFTIQDDMRNAGAEWSDEPVVMDNNLITSRKPDDLPAFNKALEDALTL